MEAGTQVGAYRIIQPVGEGGMGTVYLAEHGTLGRRAAIKVLHPMFSMRAEIVTRFFNEARAASALTDPGIIQIFDFGHHTDGSAYIVMELLEGEPLDQRLRQRRMLPADAALRIIRQVAKSLGAAHARGIVHRDLKPENIFLVRDEEVPGGERAKLLDFGIAKLLGDTSIKTQTSAVMGTPLYMSPEQCRGAGAVDERADIYSLGCVLFTLIAGRPPFDAPGGGEILAMHLRESPPRLSSLVPGISPELDALVARCLDKNPDHRFADGTALAAAIVQLAAQPTAPVRAGAYGARAAVPPHVTAGATASTTLSAATGALRPARTRKTRIAVIGAVATLAAAAVAVPLALRSSEPPAASADAAPPVAMAEPAAAAAAPMAAAPPEAPAERAASKPADSTAPVAATPAAAPTEPSPPAAVAQPPAGNTERPLPAAAVQPPAGKIEPAAPPSAEPAAAPKTARSRQEASAKPDGASSQPPALAKRDKKAAEAGAGAGSTGARAADQTKPDADKPEPDSSLPPKLDHQMVRVGVDRVRSLIVACGTAFRGVTIKVSVTVTPDGKVSSIAVKDSPDPWLTSCVTVRMKFATFRATQAGGVFNHPFTF